MPADVARLIHNMPRAGGTVVGRCIGAMRGVALLSEIHPLGRARFDPIAQAERWYGLPVGEGRGAEFADAVALIEARARERGLTLVIRDWNHMDFIGLPYAEGPSATGLAGKMELAEMLAGRFELRRIALTRHPLDETESFYRTITNAQNVPIDAVLMGFRLFAEAAAGIETVKYEDFARDPDAALQTICAALDIKFDATYRERWGDYDAITGDVTGSRGGRDVIHPVERKPVPPQINDYLQANEDYRRTCELLGYDPA